jgi:LacI family transcriptional regulator
MVHLKDFRDSVIMELKENNAIYLELSSIIKDQVLAGELKDKVPSERELAKKYNVNFKTVNKAISALVGEGLIYRVRGKGAFVKKGAHENSSLSKTIGLAVYDLKSLNSPFYSEILAGIGEVVQKSGHKLQFLTTDKNERSANKSLYYMDAWAEGGFDGMIIAGEEPDECDLDKLNSKKYPIVLLGNYLPRKRISWVWADNFKGGRDAAMHLLSLGHRRIAFIRGFDSKIDSDRIRGIKSALESKGLSLENKYVKSAYFDEKKTYDVMKQFLALTPRPTAVIASDDVTAVSAIQAIKDENLSVPEDLSIVGFNDSVLASKVTPSLTSLSLFMREMGKAAVEMLERKFKENTLIQEKKVFDPELVVRQSSAEVSQ